MAGADDGGVQPQYFSGFAIEADLKVGGDFIARAPDGSVHIGGEVIECDPPRS